MLKIEGLRKKYVTADGEIAALDNVSLKVESGECVAVVGESGSGKSTLINMVGGLDSPDAGSIYFDGYNIVELSDRRLAELRRKRIGIIYQFFNLIPELTVAENITLPVELDGGTPDTERLSEILKKIGLLGREGDYPNTLSGGQQQRVAIARALFNKPSLILADEPTGNLDAENSDEVMRLLTEMNAEYGATLIVVTHSKEIAERLGRVITMSQGMIIEDRRV